MPKYMKCPECGGDMNKDRTSLTTLLNKVGVTGEQVNPGGRTLWFRPTGDKPLHVHDNCNACDEAAIRKFLGEPEHD